jgi:hypothetical protein
MDDFFATQEQRQRRADPAHRIKTPNVPELEGVVERYPLRRLPGTFNKVLYAYKQTIQRGPFKVVIVDTYVANAQDESSDGYFHPIEYTKADFAQGQAKQLEWLKDVLETVYPDYLYRFGQAMLGLNRASYGVATYYDLQLKRWQSKVGGFGSQFHADHPPTDNQAMWPDYLNRPVPLLKMEAYLDVRLPRPFAVEEVSPPNRFLAPHIFDFTSPPTAAPWPQMMIEGWGKVYEPGKFKMDTGDKLNHLATTQLAALLYEFMFPAQSSLAGSLEAQYLYTFNPRRPGILLYGHRGMQILEQYPQKWKDKRLWQIFGESAADFSLKFSPDPLEMDQSRAATFIRSLRESVRQQEARLTAPIRP